MAASADMAIEATLATLAERENHTSRRQTRGRVTQAPFTSLNPFRKASLRGVTTHTNYTDNIVRLGLNYRLN
jgi:hypothetical protein